jgi:hypothetical protein
LPLCHARYPSASHTIKSLPFFHDFVMTAVAKVSLLTYWAKLVLSMYQIPVSPLFRRVDGESP